MKTLFKFTSVVMMVLLIVLANISASTEAKSPESSPDGWTKGSDVEIDKVANPIPSGYQMFGKGVKITSPGKICHDFRMGQFKWVADIHRLVNGNWVKVPYTIMGWEPDEEGIYMACAQADQAGTYALFTYHTGPNKKAVDPNSGECDTNPFTMAGFFVEYVGEDGYDYKYTFEFTIESSNLPQTVTFSLLGYTPSEASISVLGPPTKTFDESSFFRGWAAGSNVENITPITVRLENGTCSFDLILSELVE